MVGAWGEVVVEEVGCCEEGEGGGEGEEGERPRVVGSGRGSVRRGCRAEGEVGKKGKIDLLDSFDDGGAGYPCPWLCTSY